MGKQDAESVLSGLRSKKIEMLERVIACGDGEIRICYIAQLTDREGLSRFVIEPLTAYCSARRRRPDAAFAAGNILIADQVQVSDDIGAMEHHILSGWTVVLFLPGSQYLAVNCRKVASRDIAAPQLMYSLRGPRDAFTENLDANLSLLRYRIKDGNLRIEKRVVGARTKSTVAVAYLEDVARPELIAEVLKRIEGIRTDGIIDSGELENALLNRKTNLFPQVGILERSDMAVDQLLEGKAVILVDGSPIALQAPKVFSEFLYSCDDRYENRFFGLFMRIIRYLALFISGTATSVYIALAEFHPDAMPASYIVTFAQMRSRAPFSAFIAVLSIEFIVELLREALLRVPVKIGSAIGIVGAIIIGQAASASGIYSPLLLILTSIGFLASFAIPDITFSNSMRIIKFLIIILTGFFGFYGFSLGVTFVLMLFVSNDSFGIPYFAPWSPFNFYDFIRTFLFGRMTSPKRQQYMRNKDDTRAPGDPNKM